MATHYKEDLAFIHDAGFADWSLKSAPFLLQTLSRHGIHDGLVVDLGCGSGVWARELAVANYSVLGIDLSEAMIRLARKRVPDGRFRVGSLFTVKLPPCNAVTSLGECVNYLFDSRAGKSGLTGLFHRVYDALAPGGVFIFDIAEPGQVIGASTTRGFTEGKDWVVLVEKTEDHETSILTRRIVTFRKVGQSYRRSEEMHQQRLYSTTHIARELRRVGFRVRTIRSYGSFKLPKAHAAFIARRPD